MLYYCDLCEIFVHVHCAQATIPFFIDQPRRHDHTLTLFPRQASLTCNVCSLVNELHLTYICAICDYVAHKDCIYIPHTIRISRHHHRISFNPSLPSQVLPCGVCRREVDSDHCGAYTCNKCNGCYAVHTRCALRHDIWDGIELEGVPEEEEDVEPFTKIADGIIFHFCHGHHLKLETSTGVYDENKFCQACVLPIYGGNFYSCVECDFILHETCAYAPRKKVHPLHPHPLQLKDASGEQIFCCDACTRLSNGFIYKCTKEGCDYKLDMRCALVSEPFEYQGHQDSLFLSLNPKEKPPCHVCKSMEGRQQVLNCTKCDFVICFKCATLPYTPRYKHDEHYLVFCRGDEAGDSDWCELCEGKLTVGGEKEGFYKCNDCCTTLHINCLLGITPYLKPSQKIKARFHREYQLLRNNSQSRPFCNHCKIHCPYPIYWTNLQASTLYTYCSSYCARRGGRKAGIRA
ncbi:hypothetical protein N665_0009s0065 [Sinapis alba]|nr:hypothetical protein N665_0009s0065 [Sinapis alba]